MPLSKLPNETTGVGAPGESSRALPGWAGEGTRPYAGSGDPIPFRNPDTAKDNLERVGARLSPALASALPGLLAEAPDPDGALLLFERLIEVARAAGCCKLQLISGKHRTGAHAFYRSVGMEAVAEGFKLYYDA